MRELNNLKTELAELKAEISVLKGENSAVNAIEASLVVESDDSEDDNIVVTLYGNEAHLQVLPVTQDMVRKINTYYWR